MTEYADLKVSPILREVLLDAAVATYDQEHRAISRAGHEAVIAWLALRVDPDVRQEALEAHGFRTLEDLVDELTNPDSLDGRFAGDEKFDPMAAIRTPRDIPEGDE